MGFSLPILRLIVRQHLQEPLGPRVCTLGRQRVIATYDELVEMMVEEGWTPRALPDGVDKTTNIPSWRLGAESRYTSDLVFFGLLGVESVTAVDISGYEEADVMWDLNAPLPAGLTGPFDTVIDGGTIEHVHNVHEAIKNVNRLVRVGGRVMHFTPASNYIDHGYHQLSPIFFLDYYAANLFDRCDAWLFEHIRPLGTIDRWNLYRYRPGVPAAPFSWLRSNRSWGTFAVARKGTASTVDTIPVQGTVTVPWRDADAAEVNRKLAISRLRVRLEPVLKRHPWVWKVAVRLMVVGRSLVFGPTRHTYLGKL